jgi:hypothetical protein
LSIACHPFGPPTLSKSAAFFLAGGAINQSPRQNGLEMSLKHLPLTGEVIRVKMETGLLDVAR